MIKNNKEQTTKKALVILLTVLCVSLLALALTACTQSQKKNAVEAYGEAKAYNRTSVGVIKTAPSKMLYYIPDSVTGDYRNISEQAINKADTLTNSVTVNKTNNSGSDFRFAVIPSYPENPTVLAFNSNQCSSTSGVIFSSTITYVSGNMNSKSYDDKLHVALHEMGHSFGLGHIDAKVAPEMRGKTVMLTLHPAKKYICNDYTEFDRYNITWKYN